MCIFPWFVDTWDTWYSCLPVSCVLTSCFRSMTNLLGKEFLPYNWLLKPTKKKKVGGEREEIHGNHVFHHMAGCCQLSCIVTWEEEASLNDWLQKDYFWVGLPRLGRPMKSHNCWLWPFSLQPFPSSLSSSTCTSHPVYRWNRAAGECLKWTQKVPLLWLVESQEGSDSRHPGFFPSLLQPPLALCPQIAILVLIFNPPHNCLELKYQLSYKEKEKISKEEGNPVSQPASVIMVFYGDDF